MLVRWALFGLVLVWGLFSVGALHATTLLCGPREGFLEGLKKSSNETPVQHGLVNGNLMELLVSPDGETWTLLLSQPNGITCAVAAGVHWEASPTKSQGH